MSKVWLKIGSAFDDETGYDEVLCPADTLVPDTHQYLLDFIGMDLNGLEAAATDCLSGMDFASPSRSPRMDREGLSQVRACLEAIHPIYKHSSFTAFIQINEAFIRRIAYRLSRECREPMDKKRFRSFARTVCEERFLSEACLERYLPYAMQRQVASDDQMEELIFPELHELQHTIKLLMYIVFDCTNQQFAPIPIEKRAGVYCALFQSEYNPFLSITSEMAISSTPNIQHMVARTEFADADDSEVDFFQRLADSADRFDAVPPDELMVMMHEAKQIDEELVGEIYDTMTIRELFSYEMMEMMKQQVRIKRCKNCHAYFVIDNPKVDYCMRIAEGETKRCKEIGKTRTYQQKIGEDEAMLSYRRAYKRHYAKTKAGYTSKGDFSVWVAEASDKLAQVKGGQLSIEAFEAWLKPPKYPRNREKARHD